MYKSSKLMSRLIIVAGEIKTGDSTVLAEMLKHGDWLDLSLSPNRGGLLASRH